jgi:predicted transcriptional regulator YdeE
MEPEFQDRAAFRVMGVLVRVTPENEDFHDIWMNRFMARHDEIRPHSTDGACYGVGFASGQQGAMDYLAGMAVGEVASVPEGLVVRDVPPARDAVFQCTVATIGQTFDAIFRQWLPASPYEPDPEQPGFERYPPNTTSGDSPVFLHIPVRERSPRDERR